MRCLWIVSLLLSTEISYAAKTIPCGKANIASAENCKDVNVNFDLTECGDRETFRNATVVCKKNRATAKVTLENHLYQVQLIKVESSSGELVWEAEGPMQKSLIATPSKITQETTSMPSAPSKDKMPETTLQTQTPVQSLPLGTPPSVESRNALTSGLSFSGQFDGYYSYNFNHPPTTAPVARGPVLSVPNGNNALRAYDLYANQFALNFAELTVKKTGTEVSFTMDLDFGQEADYNAALATSDGFSIDGVSRHLGQAYLTYVPAGDSNFVFDLGKMDSHLGLETPKARDDWQYSRSSLSTYGGPIWHVGFHAGYALVPNKFWINGYIYNGWNTVYNANSGRTYGAQIKYMPMDELTIVYNLLTGPEENESTAQWRTVHEVTATWNATRNFAVALDLLTGREPDAPLLSGQSGVADWRGVTLGVKAQLSNRFSISPRLEVFRDFSGFLLGPLPESIYSATLTGSYVLAEGLECRLEARVDRTDVPSFAQGSGDQSKTQPTVLLAFLFGF